jgi:hypothetical protein
VLTGAYRCLQVGYGRSVEVLQVATGLYRALQVGGEGWLGAIVGPPSKIQASGLSQV